MLAITDGETDMVPSFMNLIFQNAVRNGIGPKRGGAGCFTLIGRMFPSAKHRADMKSIYGRI